MIAGALGGGGPWRTHALPYYGLKISEMRARAGPN